MTLYHNIYNIFGYYEPVSIEHVKKRYKQLILSFHPDASSTTDNKGDDKYIRTLNKYYSLLKNKTIKSLYDKVIIDQISNINFIDFSLDEIEDILNNKTISLTNIEESILTSLELTHSRKSYCLYLNYIANDIDINEEQISTIFMHKDKFLDIFNNFLHELIISKKWDIITKITSFISDKSIESNEDIFYIFKLVQYFEADQDAKAIIINDIKVKLKNSHGSLGFLICSILIHDYKTLNSGTN